MKLKHPKSDRRITVSADQADVYKSRGWVEYRDAAKKEADPKGAKS